MNDNGNESQLLGILRSIGSEIPRLSTDFITPDGIDFRKMKASLMNARFCNIMPACTLITDLADQLTRNSTGPIKDFIGFSRNAIALYSIMDTIHSNIVPSYSMENRNDIIYWKNIGAKFGISIPQCEVYNSSGCSDDIPLTEVLFYLACKLKLRTVYDDIVPGSTYRYEFSILGIDGDVPTMASNGAISIQSDCTVLMRSHVYDRDTGELMYELYYCVQICTAGGMPKQSSMPVQTEVYIGSGRNIIEHSACSIDNDEIDSVECIKAMLSFIYRGLDSTHYHYFADWSRLAIRSNNDIRCTDADAWVESDSMRNLTDECDRVTEANMARSYALVGPPGTGKTSTCEHIMMRLASKGYTIIRCTLTERYLETSLNKIMTAINMCAKSVVLLDDIDSLDISCKCSEVNLLIEFFAKVQRSGHPVIVFSTVNNPRDIHSTVMGRSGRIDEVILVDYPDREMTGILLRKYCRKNGYCLADSDYDKAAEKLSDSKVSVADIKNLASMMLFKHGKKDTYSMEEVDVAINALLSSRVAASHNYCEDDE